MDLDHIKSTVVGRWPGIMTALNIDIGEINKHHPCPVCGGKDRFRFDDLEGRGTWICNQCGAGDGWALIQKALNIAFPEAVNQVAEIIGSIDRSPIKRKSSDPRRRLNELWLSSLSMTGSDRVTKYLRARGLIMAINDVRYCPACYEPDAKIVMPAMVALVRNAQGKAVSIHRTYLDGPRKAKIKSPKKLMPGTEALTGCAIRLFDAGDTLGLTEGIETAVAARQLFDIPAWATISSTIMESFVPPQNIRRIIIFGDNDANYAGQTAAYRLAKRLFQQNYVVEVQIPDTPGDWADEVERQARKGGRRC